MHMLSHTFSLTDESATLTERRDFVLCVCVDADIVLAQ